MYSFRYLTLFFILFINGFTIYAQSIEVKIDNFYAEFIKELKLVKSEKNDEKAIVLMKQMKLDLAPKAEDLGIELETYLATLSEEKLFNWEDKIRDKPFNKEIFDLTFDVAFIERINRNQNFDVAYNDLIDLSDKVIEVEFAEPVDPDSKCIFTLNGSNYKNQSFNLPPSGMKDAAAYLDEGNLTFNIEGYASSSLVGLSFFIPGSKPGIYKWKGDYNFTLTMFDGKNELVFGGHEGNGTINVENIESIGGWIAGKFAGKLISDDDAHVTLELKGNFKVRRDIEE